MNYVVDESEIRLMKSALDYYVKKFPQCSVNFQVLNDKLTRLGYGGKADSNLRKGVKN